MNERKRLLIEDWLPIAEIGIESLRERTPMTPFPAPNRLHVWFARRPLVASRAAILGSLLPADYDRKNYLHLLGIHGDAVAGAKAIAEARLTGVRVDNPYGYDRAFNFTPPPQANLAELFVLDPTAGGGSIPFEASRLGAKTIGNDLNPVASLLLKCTVEFPNQYGAALVERFEQIATEFLKRVRPIVAEVFPSSPNPNIEDATYLWARTIMCPYCSGIVPLSTTWKLSGDGTGVRLIPEEHDGVRRIRFEIVRSIHDNSPGTIKGGDGLCPFPDCARTIDGDDVKQQAQAGKMGHQLYCVVYKEQRVKGYTKDGRPKYEKIQGFRAPRQEDDVNELVRQKLAEKMPVWQARSVLPIEHRYLGDSDRCGAFGVTLFTDMFSPRQLFSACTSIEVFQDLVEARTGALSELDKAALTYLALAIDKVIDYNSLSCLWHPGRGVMAHTFHRHDFFFKYATAEMTATMPGSGYEWAVRETGRSLRELVELLGQHTGSDGRLSFAEPRPMPTVRITCGSADNLPLENSSVDCIVMDPPYYQNVMYAELSDFFYVWLKRTAGLLYPDLFQFHLTDKDREAVANFTRFTGQKGGAKNLAKVDYQNRMAAIFKEQRRVLKANGVMTVMFTHKEADAWDALAKGLIEAGFIITASWPVNTEAEGSLHIREKSAARSTIFLVCRARSEEQADADERYWEDIEPQVRQAVRDKVTQFQDAGIGGIDLYLACFGPALQVFTEAWPLRRGKPRPEPKGKQRLLLEKFDPYAATPEDALEAARREVKQWRFQQLATIQRQHHLDPLTEWYVLAWDAFRAPRFPADEGLKLARVVGLDFDADVKKVVCDVKSDDILLWDSKTRQASGKLGHVGDACMLDTLHHAARVAREQNTGAAKNLLESAKLLDDPTLLTALEALLNVLPPGMIARGKKKPDLLLSGAANDFEALENLRKLAFAEAVPPPKIPEQLPLTVADSDEEDEGSDESAA
jgi:putative DNA methylase